MKKQVYLFAALLLMATAGYSQLIRKDGMIVERPKFGVQGGLVVSSQTIGNGVGDAYEASSKANFTAGVNLELPLRYGWYLQPEVNYSVMGSKEATGNGTTGISSFNFNYLQVPILIKFKPLFSGFGVFLGPQYGYLLSANQHDRGLPNVDIKSGNYTSELSALFGMEYYFPAAHDGPQFGLSARYQIGITNTNNTNTLADGTYYTQRNNGFFLTAGIRF